MRSKHIGYLSRHFDGDLGPWVAEKLNQCFP